MALVSDLSVAHVFSFPTCKVDSSEVSVSSVSPSPTSTSALEMNNIMNSDAALSSVIIPETKEKHSHFHISCLLSGHHRTVKVAAMVDSGATLLFLDKKYADHHKMLLIPLDNPIHLFNIDGTPNEAGSITHMS